MMRMLVNEIADARPRLSAIGEATAAADFLQLWMDFFVRNRRRAQGSVKAINEASAPGAGGVSEPENRHLAPGEVVERLHSLSAGELKKLRLIEQRELVGADFSSGTLYQEAVSQALLGERHCPRDVTFGAFLVQSMRSIASHRRAALARQGSDEQSRRLRKSCGPADRGGPTRSGGNPHRAGGR